MTSKIFIFFTLLFIGVHANASNEDAALKETIQARYEELEYHIENPLIIQNPFKRNELTALVRFPTEKPAQITLTIFSKDGNDHITHTFSNFNTEHAIPVLGLYPNHNNKISLKALYKDNTTKTVYHYIQTPKINKRALYIIKDKKDKQNFYHYLYNGLVVDEKGHIRFSFQGDYEMVYFANNELIAEDRNFGLIRYNMLGEKISTYSYPKDFVSFTHGLTQKTNKNFLVIGSFPNKTAIFNNQKAQTQRDFLIEIDYNTGKTINIIDLADILNPDRSVIIKSDTKNYGLNNWCHLNAVDYDEKDQSILVSCRHAGLIKIDEKTKSVKYIISPHIGFEKSGRDGTGPALSDKLLTAIDEQGIPFSGEIQRGTKKSNTFKWPTKTHDARIVSNNIISVFDNSGSVYAKNLITSLNSNAQVFKIDEQKKTIQSIWFKALPFYSDSGSSVLFDENKTHVTVYTSVIKDNEQIGWAHGRLMRFDKQTKETLFDAIIYRGGETYFYGLQPFTFYQESTSK